VKAGERNDISFRWWEKARCVYEVEGCAKLLACADVLPTARRSGVRKGGWIIDWV
jgi:hypothetical protein